MRAALVSAVEPVAAEPEPAAAPAPPRPEPSFVVLRPAPGSRIVVRARPGGRVVARLGARTEFGSPTTLAVAAKRGRWLGVVTTLFPTAASAGSIPPRAPSSPAGRASASPSTSRRGSLVVSRGDRVLRRVTVAVGAPGSPTPTGRFAVTDKLAGSAFSSAYGCCILALSAHQPSLPSGWQGGDRIAVHGTNDPGSIGAAASAGCPRASDADMRYLLRAVPLGAPVFVRA